MDPTPAAVQNPIGSKHHGLWWYAWRRLRASLVSMVGLVLGLFLLVIAAAGPWLAPRDYRATSNEAAQVRQPPSRDAWFGRDELGRDMLSRVLQGAHLTLGTGALTVLLAIFAGGPLGLLCGYFGGWFDGVVMRVCDVVLALPNYLLALAIMAVLGPSLFNAMLAVGIGFTPKFARILRASAMQEAGRDYVLAARAVGAGHARILLTHVLPNSLAPLMVMATLSLGTAILYTSSLSFLGLGAQPPMPEWGAMLAEGRESALRAPHLMFFPGGAIALAVLAVNLLGDGLRDALDVRL